MALLVVGIILSLAPLCGLLSTVAAMRGAFSEFNQTGDIAKDALTANLASSLSMTSHGLKVALVGVMAIVAAAVWLLALGRRSAEMP